MSKSRIVEDEIDTSYDLKKSKHVEEIRAEAIKCMTVFFKKKSHWAGGSIPKTKLFKEEHIRAVMEMNIMDALALAYYCLNKSKPDSINTDQKGWDIELCYECIKECQNTLVDKTDLRAKIPKCHAGGILLVYLSMCHGVDFIPTLKKLGEIKSMIAQKEKEMELRIIMDEQEKELQDEQDEEDED